MTQLIEKNRFKALPFNSSDSKPYELGKQKQMLLIIPVPFRVKDNQLLFESQACNGLERWADNFESVIVAAPVIPEEFAEKEKAMIWQNTDTLAKPERFEFVPLPWAYSPLKFLSTYSSVRATLAQLISRSHYLQFAIGSIFGDWAAIGALEAKKQGRAYAIHTDRVEHRVMRRTSEGAKLKTRIKAKVMAPLMANYHQQIIKGATLGLWNGQDCYDAYSPFCENSHLIHDIHTKASDIISSDQLSEKVNQAKSDETIRICYAGRLDPMKAPFDWVKAVETALNMGVKLHATWLGDGSLFAETKAMISDRGLEDAIELLGFESDRQKLLKRIRESHIMLFTHVTPESPRCLIEALTNGTPIVGYESPYVHQLLKEFGGGTFVPVNQWQQLGEVLVSLSQDRQILMEMTEQAGINGKRFHDQKVFEERSNLIKTHLA
ncbi:MAG: glycosyltransferase [Coleofasciculaceae cyanobacterium]